MENNKINCLYICQVHSPLSISHYYNYQPKFLSFTQKLTVDSSKTGDSTLEYKKSTSLNAIQFNKLQSNSLQLIII